MLHDEWRLEMFDVVMQVVWDRELAYGDHTRAVVLRPVDMVVDIGVFRIVADALRQV